MNPQQKRTVTQPGLGQVGESRRTTTSEREAQPAEVKGPPTSRRPTKGGPPPGEEAEKTEKTERMEKRASSRALPAVEQPKPARLKSPVPVARSKSPLPKKAQAPPAKKSARSMPRHETPSPKTDTRRRSIAERAERPAVSVDHVGSVVGRASSPQILTGRAIPRVIRSRAEIAEAPIDHRAGFLLAYIDGSTNVQGLVDIDVMPEKEVHEILDRLRRLGIVAIR